MRLESAIRTEITSEVAFDEVIPSKISTKRRCENCREVVVHPQENSEEKLLSTSILGIPVSVSKISVEIVTWLWIVAENVLRCCDLRPIVVIAVTRTESLREFEHSIERDVCDGAKKQVHFCRYS